MSVFRPVADPQAALSWIPADVLEEGELCGLDVPGWEDETWILHDAIERTDALDPHRRRRTRHRWRDLTDRDLAAVAAAGVSPPDAMHLLKGHSRPEVTIEEGVFEGESQTALLDLLKEFSGAQTGCFAFFGTVTAYDVDRLAVLEGPLAAITTLRRAELFCEVSPSNWWPADRSWFVWTDYDLTATRVSGPRSLIQQVRAHPALETVGWRRPDGMRTSRPATLNGWGCSGD
ncbi:hypothetical protein [Myceligenerans indicum]|uniref:Uncharacterized protein n=1 Tax=Myceligenerans indicum TaxID=2593663 RepID=A0ABS1LRK7_9MICO|nr:hypothetical protein [Myceligenerans indicum]MBL0888921.1 hypothetical protein [Myceligenerans indicum]